MAGFLEWQLDCRNQFWVQTHFQSLRVKNQSNERLFERHVFWSLRYVNHVNEIESNKQKRAKKIKWNFMVAK